MTDYDVKRILCPTDFSASATYAFRHALAIAARHGASVELLHVTEPSTYDDDVISDRCANYSACLLERLAALIEQEAKDKGVSVKPRVATGTPYLEIVRRATEWPADWIVLGTHGRTGLPHLLIGSVAERVVRMAHCPVLTVR